MKNIVSLLIVVISLFLINSSTYTVPEYQQALVLQLGKVKGKPITEAGLHFKLPFIQEVRFFEKRILQWDGQRGYLPTKDKKYVWVDTTARWQIDNSRSFYEAVRNIVGAEDRMGRILNGATRDIISQNVLIETIRNTNKILEDFDRNIKEQNDIKDISDKKSRLKKISIGREEIAKQITEKASKELKNFGIKLIDVQIRSIAYQKEVEEQVYERMISERNRISAKIRSEGEGQRKVIEGERNIKLKTIQSESYRTAQEIRGQADAEATKIYAESYGKGAKFYNFIKTLETYKNTLKDRGEFILSTDNAFLKLLKDGK